MTADSYQLAVPTSPAFEGPYRLYYRFNGVPMDVRFLSRSDWIERSNTSQQDYPRWASLMQTASAVQIELDRKLSSSFIATIGSLTLEYLAAITRLASGTDESILPDSLRHHIVALAGVRYALGQGDRDLAQRLTPMGELAREAVRAFELTQLSRPRQLRPNNFYAPSELGGTGWLTSDYRL